MLQELDIKDFALIEHTCVSWTKGLNVLTGETGAGKSILIDALNAVLGGKVGPSTIRNGCERAVIEATFGQSPPVAAWLKQQELQADELDSLIVSREITRAGSRSRINGTLVNLSLVQELRPYLLTIHAQHEARTLLSSQSQLEMLDGLADPAHKKLQDKVRTLHARRRELKSQLSDLVISEEERLRRLDFARFQLNELEEAALQDPDEDSWVANQQRVLANVAQLDESTRKGHGLLAGGEAPADACVVDLLQEVLSAVERAAGLDSRLASVSDALEGCLGTVEEAARELRRYRESLDTDPEALSGLEARLALLATIKRKYGPALADAIARRSELVEEVAKLENVQSRCGELQSELSAVEEELSAQARQLSARRLSLSRKVSGLIQSELVDLGMERCRFEISLEAVEIGQSGLDRIEFLIAPNPGQPLMPVAKIASGGEISRVMLAVKSIFAEADQVATVVFDEIDTGLSGRVLQTMRDKLVQLARSHQILCITHQPLIASVANRHLEVTKEQSARATQIGVRALDPDQRVKALASLASGQDDQQEALRFARSLMDEASRLGQ